MDSSTVKFYTTIMVHTRFEDDDSQATCTDGIPSRLFLYSTVGLCRQ